MATDPEQSKTGSPLKIGELLVKEGFVHPSDIDTALEIQRKEIANARLPLGKFLVKQGLISTGQLQKLLSHSAIRDSIGEWAVASGILDQASLASFVIQKKPEVPLDAFLIKRGLIHHDQVRTFLSHQLDCPCLGELAVRLHLLDEAQLAAAMRVRKNHRTIGEILCNRNLITPIDLNTVLAKYRKHLKLGKILMNRGIINQEALHMAIEAQKHRPNPIGKILQDQGQANENEIYEAFSIQYNLPLRTYEGLSFSNRQRAELTDIIGQDFASRFHILPVSLNANRLTVAICHPDSIQVLRVLRTKQVDLRIDCTLVTETVFQRLFHLLYGSPPSESVGVPEPTGPSGNPKGAARRSSTTPPAATNAADEMIRFLLNQALQWRAKSIHIDLDQRGSSLRFRIEGRLKSDPPPWFEKKFREIAGDVLRRIREMAGVQPDDNRTFWEGRVDTSYHDPAKAATVQVGFYAAGCFTPVGESATLTFEDPLWGEAGAPPPELSPAVRSTFHRLLTGGPGLVLVSSAGGAHPLETVRCVLEGFRSEELKILLISGPVDHRLPHAIRIEAPRDETVSRESFFQTVLKLDPDVLVLDMLQEASSARFALEAGQSLRCIGTLRANDAAQALIRLRSLGADPDVTADRLLGILAATPVKRLCSQCKMPHQPPASKWQSLFDSLPEHLSFYEAGKGCEACGYSGYKGQVMLSELLQPGERLRAAIRSRASEPLLRRLAIREGMRSVVENGISRLHETSLTALLEAVPFGAARTYLETQRGYPLEPGEAPVHMAIISAPEQQVEVLTSLHSAYERLIEAKGLRTATSGESLFIDFIKDHFRRICQSHGCRRVIFMVMDGQDRALLTATPLG
jgi:type IV pilus assembly protein PilB